MTIELRNARTRQASFTSHQRKKICEDLITLAQKKSTMASELENFSGWMDQRKGHPYTVILDGANINASSAESMVARLEEMGECPLVILPEKTAAYATRATKNLKKKDRLYIVPNGYDDDCFGMIATVVDQKGSCSGHFGPHAPGVRPLLISNDRLWDHRRQIRNRKLFASWYKYHTCRHCELSGKVKLLPRILSRKIESNEIPTNHGLVWHFPVYGWGFHERFLVHFQVGRPKN